MVAGIVLVASACSVLPDFEDNNTGDFRPRAETGTEGGPQPQVPNLPGAPGSQAPSEPPAEPNGCDDPDPAIIETCLDSVSALIPIEGARLGMAAERTTGRILLVELDRDPVELARVGVTPTGDGGLTGLSLSPHYSEDELLFAYITTPSDNRVVRIARGDTPKVVLAGLPRGAVGNAGSITVDPDGALLVATGDGGNPAAADDPASLAGKVLRIDELGRPAPGNPNPASPILASGLHSPGGFCADRPNRTIWVTDRAPGIDVMHRVGPGPLGNGEWTWPDRPGVGGCAVVGNELLVTLSATASVYTLGIGPDGAGFVGTPRTSPFERYGRITATAVSPDGVVWFGTSNKSGGNPISSDDRVFRLINPDNAGGPD